MRAQVTTAEEATAKVIKEMQVLTVPGSHQMAYVWKLSELVSGSGAREFGSSID